VQEVVSNEQERDFRMSTLALSLGLFGSVLFALVASFILLVAILRIERARIEREERFAKARRLRNKADSAEVTVPPITHGVPKHFHVFLSHVWGYGCAATHPALLLLPQCFSRVLIADGHSYLWLVP
jgi:hypothetical protein